MGCTNTSKYVGRTATLEVAIQCPDVDPSSATYLAIGAVTTKSFELTANGTSVYADDSDGFDEELIVNSTLAISFEGYSRVSDGTESNQSQLFQYYFDSVKDGEQPVVLARYTWPDKTLVAYMNMNQWNRSDPVDDKAGFTGGLVKAPSPQYPPTLTDTPTP